jgi:hypothetical protein
MRSVGYAWANKSEVDNGRSMFTWLFGVNVGNSADVVQGKSMKTQESVRDFAFA